jgi:hypothetical protein
MPVHDWTRVTAGIFHDFHHEWISQLKRALNGGLLPANYYALAEQIVGGLGPDVLTLEGPTADGAPPAPSRGGVITLAANPPQVWHHARTEIDAYAARAKVLAIRHASDHRVVAVTEIVSPGNENSRHGARQFAAKAEELLRAGIHLLIVDLFPPSPRDPQGVHKLIWDELADNDFALPPDWPLTLAAYVGGPIPEAFVNVTAVGHKLPDMALFLTADEYVMVPLETTYQAAWEAVPAYWRNVLERPVAS